MALEVASLYATLGLDKSGFENGLTGAKNKLGVFGVATGTALGNVATGALRGLTSGIIELGSSTISAASDMEYQLSNIAAVMNKTKDEVDPLRQLIIDLGLDPRLKVDATQAAEAIEMLARNGLTMDEILSGAAESTVLLANATGGNFGNAADVATDAMAQFNVDAADMLDAVDGITSVTTNSKFTIDDYRLALAQAGGVASSSGVEFGDFNAVMAGISPLFASGSDAGTSFKTMLQRLNPQTDKAAEAMQALGLFSGLTEKQFEKAQKEIDKTRSAIINLDPASADYQETLQALTIQLSEQEAALVSGSSAFYDAEGNMKSMEEVAGILQGALGDLSEEERSKALSTIFGTDAMRAAVAMADLGKDGFSQLSETMGDTSAVDSAAERMDNFAGVMEIIGGIIDGIKLVIGDALLPAITSIARDAVPKLEALSDWFTETGAPAIRDFADGAGEKLLSWIDALGEGDYESVMSDIGGELGTLWDSYVVPVLSTFATKFWGWVDGPGGAVEGVGGALTSVMDTAAAWLAENWPTIQTSLSEWSGKFWDWVVGPGGALERLGETMNKVSSNIVAWAESEEGQGQLQNVGETLGTALIAGLQNIFTVDTGTAIKNFGDSLYQSLQNLGPAFVSMGGGISTGIISGIYEKLTGNEMSDQLKDILTGALKGAIEGALSILNPGKMLWDSFGDIGEGLGQLGIPGFDTGGVVPGPTGSPQLAVVHGGETILPTHKTGAAGASYNITINANDSAGGQRAGVAFVNELRSRGLVMA